MDVLALAQAWLAEDPDPETRAELQALVDAGDLAALGERFAGRLEFGTAGLRGALGAGPTRMNRVVVMRAAAGLAAYLVARGGGTVVVGYDARRNSDVFARDTADVMTGAGVRAMVLPRPLPTPVLAFAVRHLGAAAGVMVTASHNPPQDNGYKVYLGDGSQIVPPADAEISAEIDAVGPVGALPVSSEWETLGGEVVESYLGRAVGTVSPTAPGNLRIVHTALHGVGSDVVLEALHRAGFRDVEPVLEQQQPDPAFPTVSFPNPEEPGAIDLALATAVRTGADVVLANDPDADRCAVAVPAGGGGGGGGDGWRMLRGDEVGALLAAHLIAKGASGTFATSIVSSRLLSRIATAAGQRYEETLTGFKWLSRVEGLRFGYEEALGYCVDPAAVRDKDGVTAALAVAELAAGLKADGRSLLDALEDLDRRYGVHRTDQVSVRVADIALVASVVDRLREQPPRSLGGRAVERVDDLAAGVGGLPPTDGLRFFAAGGARVIVRPSGTEPKLKAYLEVVEPLEGGDLAAARARAADALAALRADVERLVATD